MNILDKLVTKETPILSLKSPEIPLETLEHIFRCDERYRPKHYYAYLRMIHEKDGVWYYFKHDISQYTYATMEELLGSYFSVQRNLPTVSYQIACLNGFSYGLASPNFKKDTHDYYYMNGLPTKDCSLYRQSIENINALRSLCKNPKNEEVFLNHLLNLFALDIYMLQKDRCTYNLMFQIEKKSKMFDIAPVYDYSNCDQCVSKRGLFLGNVVTDIELHVVKMLFRSFPEFSTIFNEVFSMNMTDYVDQICTDFHFSQDCVLYENMKEYYRMKQEKQRQYFKKFLK